VLGAHSSARNSFYSLIYRTQKANENPDEDLTQPTASTAHNHNHALPLPTQAAEAQKAAEDARAEAEAAAEGERR
jgi:hypothetical protein